jgi:Protein of unknown function (DUF3379)
MDCEQTRRAVVIDPFHLHAETQNHADQCGVCAAFLTGHQQHSTLLRRSMVQTQAPHLQERLLAAHLLSDEARPSRSHGFLVNRRWWMSAAAASVSLGAVGMGAWWRTQSGSTQQAEHWAQLMQEHFIEDPLHLLPPDPQALSQLDSVLSRIGMRRTATAMPQLLRAQFCMLRDQRSAHLVCELDGQRAVVFVLPEKTAHLAPLQAPAWAGEMHALAVGTMGVFAQNPSTLKKISAQLTSSLS